MAGVTTGDLYVSLHVRGVLVLELHQVQTDGGVRIVPIRGGDDGDRSLLEFPKLRKERRGNLVNGQSTWQERTRRETYQAADVMHVSTIVTISPRSGTSTHQARIFAITFQAAQAGDFGSHSITTIFRAGQRQRQAPKAKKEQTSWW